MSLAQQFLFKNIFQENNTDFHMYEDVSHSIVYSMGEE